MATKQAAGSTKLGRDSRAKRLGIKKFGGERVVGGNIVVRQNGTKYIPGRGVRLGKDYTIYAIISGIVKFEHKKIKNFAGKLKSRTVVNVV